MKRFIITITLLITLVGSAFAAERKIKVSQKIEEGKIPQIVIKNYDEEYLTTHQFDVEIMTNYFVTIYTNKNGTIVLCKSVGKDAESFLVVEKNIPEDELIVMFIQDFNKTWEMMKNEKND